MAASENVQAKLAEPLDPKRVQTREGSGGSRFSYIPTHDAIRTANTIFGEGSWGYEVVELVHLATEPFTRNGKAGNRVGYRAIVKVSAIGSQFSDVGYGDAQEYADSLITPHELAAKEAVSDAVKRCLKNYGDQFGLCLYDKDAPEHRGGSAARQALSQEPARSEPASPSNGQVSEFRFRTGKHKGKSLSEVPAPYLDWVLDNFKEDDDYSVEALTAIRAFRGLEAPMPIPSTDDDLPF